MRSPTGALLWQIWRHNHQAAWALIGITLVSRLADLVQHRGPPLPRPAGPGPLNELLAMISFLLLFGIFSYTEPSGDKGVGRFPARLFTLPVSTLRLVAVPMLTGVAATLLLYLTWVGRLTSGGSTSPLFVAVLLAAFMVLYQTALWTLTRFGALRLVALGAIGMALFGVGVLPSLDGSEASPWRSERVLGGAVALSAVASFLVAWGHIARLRWGGERGPSRLALLLARAVDLLPGWRGRFASPSSAQFWYEWRSGGSVLPALVSGILFLFVVPLSLLAPGDPGTGAWFVAGAFMTPIVLAVPVGMAFAKPTFWSEELSFPPFVAVRPVSSAEIVATKLRVAAMATLLSWVVVLVVVGWLLLSVNADWVSLFAIQLWAVHGHSVPVVYGIAALVVLAGIFLTWRFMIVGVWAGHSGSRRLYIWSVLLVAFFVVGYLFFGLDRLPGWLLEDPARMTPVVWTAAITVIVKYWLAARTWRAAPPPLVRRYLAVWLAGTTVFLAFGMAFWRVARIYLAQDTWRLQGLLILLALLVMPLARVGLAPALLERNRHRS